MSQIIEAALEHLSDIVIALIGLTAVVVQRRISVWSKAAAVDEKAKSLLLPAQHRPGNVNKRASVMIIGVGGVGKTTLVDNLLDRPPKLTVEKTEMFQLYYGQQKEGELTYHFHVSDYMGQNIGQLVQAFLVQQKLEYSPMAYGHVTAVIIVVDLFKDVGPTELITADGGGELLRDAPDGNRIKEHLDNWSPLALDAIFGLVTSELKYVCLFVNKADRLAKKRDNWRADAARWFEELDQNIKAKVRGTNAKYEIVVGSTHSGDGVRQVTSQLKQNSVSGETVPGDQ